MSEEEFVRWADEDNHAEWVAGRVEVKTPISDIHDQIQFWMRSLIQSFVQRRKLGIVRGPQFTLRLPEKPSRRDPDVMFVAEQIRARLRPTFLDGPAELLVETVSPDSVGRDYREKYQEYQAAGVMEYWIVDPVAQQIEAHALSAGGKYEPIPVGDDGKIHSKVLPGFWIRPADPIKDPLPEVADLLTEMQA